MKRRVYVAIAIVGIFLCLYLSVNFKYMYSADCDDSRYCHSNCTFCVKEFCFDIKSTGLCDSPEVQYRIRGYFLLLKLNEITIKEIRCFNGVVTAKIAINSVKDLLSKEQIKQHINSCNGDIWVTFTKLDLQLKNIEASPTVKTNITMGKFTTKSNLEALPKTTNNVALNHLARRNPRYEMTSGRNFQSTIDKYNASGSDVKYHEMYINNKQTNPQLNPGVIDRKQYSSVNIPTVVNDRKQYSSVNIPTIVNEELQQTFETIAENNVWKAPNETRSGKGSLLSSTVTVRECLGEWIRKYNITSVVDIPCGDGNWQRFIPGIDKISYHGFDISKFVIEIAKNRNPHNMKYGILDLTSNVPPKADLIIMRDVIQHLPLRLGRQAILNARRSGVKWIGVSSYPTAIMNHDITMGGYYKNNVQISPFFLTNVVELCDNYSGFIKESYLDSKFLLIEN